MTADQIATDVVNRIATAFASTGAQVTQEIQTQWESSISAFYSAYSPKIYTRTGSTYTASDKGANNYCAVSGSHVEVRAGILVGPDFMSVGGGGGTGIGGFTPYADGVDTVFEQTYSGGIHGKPSIAITTPPRDIFEPWFNSMKAIFIQMILSSAGF